VSTTRDRAAQLDVAIAITGRAAAIVRGIYESNAGVAVDYKGPNDPVTRADREVNALLCEELGRAFPGTAIVAEESDAATYESFRTAPAIWFVDPLDGTREFVQRIDEFAVMVGLVEGDTPVLGVIHAPSTGRRIAGAEGVGAFEIHEDGSRTPIHVTGTRNLAAAHMVLSRSRPDEDLVAAARRIGMRVSNVGSAGIKAMRVATGEADLYAHPSGAGYRWDACAAEAIIRAAGGNVTDDDGARLDYRGASLRNDRGVHMTNGHLHEATLALVKGRRSA